jgi:hypothetical protein
VPISGPSLQERVDSLQERVDSLEKELDNQKKELDYQKKVFNIGDLIKLYIYYIVEPVISKEFQKNMLWRDFSDNYANCMAQLTDAEITKENLMKK